MDAIAPDLRNDQKRRAYFLKILFEQQDGRCAYCDKPMHLSRTHNSLQASYEHKVPASRGGGTTLENGVASCRRCNSTLKGQMTHDEFVTAIHAFGGVDELARAFRRAQEHVVLLKQARRQKVLRLMKPWLFENRA